MLHISANYADGGEGLVRGGKTAEENGGPGGSGCSRPARSGPLNR